MATEQYTLYLSVLLPLPLKEPIYTYAYELSGREATDIEGRLVVVPFGPQKRYTGLIVAQQHQPPVEGRKLKTIEQLLPYPPLPPYAIELWRWVAGYYVCSLGDVLTAAVPQGIRQGGNQEERLKKSALTLKGWLPSHRIATDQHLRGHLQTLFKSGSAAAKATEYILAHYQEGSLAPMTLRELEGWLGTSNYTINKLRRAGVIEECEVLASELKGEALRPTERVGDKLSASVSVGSSRIALLYCPGSSLRERIPYDYLLSSVVKGKQVLLLFPNLESLRAVQPKLQKLLGPKLLSYYAGASDKERLTTWVAALRGESGVYIGLRAAVWLPLAHLGEVVVVDEEGRGYRQYEPAPRFTATNVALMLARLAKVNTLLVSATPSIESYTLALQQRYSFVKVETSRPEVRVQSVWMPKAFKENGVQGRMLSYQMIGAIRDAIEEEGLALLLYQRKGFARRVTCRACEASPQCPHCHTTLRYIEQSRLLACGMCGYYQPMPTHCPECGAGSMQLVGTGIERLRRAMEELFPGVPIKMEEEIDHRKKLPPIILSSSYQPPLEYLAKATTIGWVQVDLLYTLSDYRANELTYQYLVQSQDEAPHLQRLVIQHFAKEPNALTAFKERDYQRLLDHELEERSMLLFPPFARHLDLYFESPAQAEAYKLATSATQLFRQRLSGVTLLGPAPMPVHKKETAIGYKVTLLAPLKISSMKLRASINRLIEQLLKSYRGPKMNCYFDVDPL